MEGVAQDAAARVAAAITDDLNYGERLTTWRAALRAEFPDWQCWYVLRYAEGTTLWCARPADTQDASQNVYGDSAVELAEAITVVITGVVP